MKGPNVCIRSDILTDQGCIFLFIWLQIDKMPFDTDVLEITNSLLTWLVSNVSQKVLKVSRKVLKVSQKTQQTQVSKSS